MPLEPEVIHKDLAKKGGAVSVAERRRDWDTRQHRLLHILVFFRGKHGQDELNLARVPGAVAYARKILHLCVYHMLQGDSQPLDLSWVAHCVMEGYKETLSDREAIPRAIAVLRCTPSDLHKSRDTGEADWNAATVKALGFYSEGGHIIRPGCTLSIGESAWVEVFVLPAWH